MAGYAGDISPQETWDGLTKNDKAQLIDVRTMAEWTFVGLPDLSALGREPILLEWQGFPSMQENESFAQTLSAELAKRGADQSTPLYFICRSGGRSRAAAIAMTREGYGACFNVITGFEGDLDNDKHRGTTAGWKADGLPWGQN
ncbi:MAG: rhodanese-like domain-containing protein [Pseudomonadota bacterium]